MKKCISLISFNLILIFTQSCYAIKSTITEHNNYTDTETNFFDEQGNKVFLDQYEGSTVLLVFWATWCGTCVSELQDLDNLQKDFRKLPFKVIAVSEDYQGIEVVKKHFESSEIRHLEIFYDYQNQLFRALSVVGLPTAFLINTDGKVKKIFKGKMKWHDDKIRAMLLSEIEGNPEIPKNTYRVPSLNRQVGKVVKTIQQVPNEKGENNNAEEKSNDKKTNQSK